MDKFLQSNSFASDIHIEALVNMLGTTIIVHRVNTMNRNRVESSKTIKNGLTQPKFRCIATIDVALVESHYVVFVQPKDYKEISDDEFREIFTGSSEVDFEKLIFEFNTSNKFC